MFFYYYDYVLQFFFCNELHRVHEFSVATCVLKQSHAKGPVAQKALVLQFWFKTPIFNVHGVHFCCFHCINFHFYKSPPTTREGGTRH